MARNALMDFPPEKISLHYKPNFPALQKDMEKTALAPENREQDDDGERNADEPQNKPLAEIHAASLCCDEINACIKPI
jgi:hypothetical protein